MVSEKKVLQGAFVCGAYMHQQSQQKNALMRLIVSAPKLNFLISFDKDSGDPALFCMANHIFFFF